MFLFYFTHMWMTLLTKRSSRGDKKYYRRPTHTFTQTLHDPDPTSLFADVWEVSKLIERQLFGNHDGTHHALYSRLRPRVCGSASLSICLKIYPLKNFDLVNGTTTPTLAWILPLPTDMPINVWGVYLHVFTKPDCLLRIYIGVAVAVYRGLRARVGQYSSESQQGSIPETVK